MDLVQKYHSSNYFLDDFFSWIMFWLNITFVSSWSHNEKIIKNVVFDYVYFWVFLSTWIYKANDKPSN